MSTEFVKINVSGTVFSITKEIADKLGVTVDGQFISRDPSSIAIVIRSLSGYDYSGIKLPLMTESWVVQDFCSFNLTFPYYVFNEALKKMTVTSEGEYLIQLTCGNAKAHFQKKSVNDVTKLVRIGVETINIQNTQVAIINVIIPTYFNKTIVFVNEKGEILQRI
jgi:hypothetical protein